MKELKVGNYIRTKDKKGVQYIRKIIDLPKDTRYGSIVVDKDIHNVKWVSKKNVLKVSENIINLIQSGDYVNGEFVVQVSNDKGWVFTQPTYFDEHRGEERHYCYNSYEIKSVVTKEQFNSVKYEVK